MPQLTLITAFYRNPSMLERQLEEWEKYPSQIEIVVVDDGSPEPARDVLAVASAGLRSRLRLYRIGVDLPWNREGARNLGATKAQTDWIGLLDIDHILPVAAATHLVEIEPSPHFWYRFPGTGNGAQDGVGDEAFLITRDMYWGIGGYDEDFAGCSGGGADFLRRLERNYGAPLPLPADIRVHVEAGDAVAAVALDTRRGERIARHKAAGRRLATKPLRFPWAREL